jgi:membrane-bound lytic murein transglycosylase B
MIFYFWTIAGRIFSSFPCAGDVVANSVKQFLLRSAFLCLLAGCASDPEPLPSPITPAQPLPPQSNLPAPTRPYSQYPSKMPSFSSNYGGYENSYQVRNFIRHMVQTHGFSESYLQNLFAQANRLDSVIRLEGPSSSNSGPARPGSWSRYRGKFLTEQHISNGAAFWRENAEAISKASAAYGVDPEYIVGIIGVETYFGRNIGKTCVFDALTTLSFDTYRRSKYFMSELEHFLLMTREEHYNPREPVGSWAGAMGLGQFMPSSFRKLAIDFDHNGRRDLWHPYDAIGSVAHYFSRNGWQFKNPVTSPAYDSYEPSVITLSTYEGDEHWRVYPNFKVIKRYNNSNKYAMAVHQLAQAIKQRYQSTQLGQN